MQHTQSKLIKRGSAKRQPVLHIFCMVEDIS